MPLRDAGLDDGLGQAAVAAGALERGEGTLDLPTQDITDRWSPLEASGMTWRNASGPEVAVRASTMMNVLDLELLEVVTGGGQEEHNRYIPVTGNGAPISRAAYHGDVNAFWGHAKNQRQVIRVPGHPYPILSLIHI